MDFLRAVMRSKNLRALGTRGVQAPVSLRKDTTSRAWLVVFTQGDKCTGKPTGIV